MSFQVTKRSREVCDYIEGVVDTKTDIASVGTFYSIGSRLTVLNSGDIYVLTSAGWKLLPTTEEKLGKLPREISITAGAHSTLTVKKTATIAGELDDEITLTDGSFVYRGDVITVSIECDNNYTGKVYVNEKELNINNGEGSFTVGIGNTTITSDSEIIDLSENEQNEQPSNDIKLEPFVIGDDFIQVKFNEDLSEEEIISYLPETDDLCALAASYNIVMFGVREGVQGIGFGVSNQYIYAAEAVDGHFIKGWQDSWEDSYASWDKDTKILTSKVGTLTVTSIGSDANGVLFGKVSE